MSIDSPLEQQERYIAYGSGAYFVIVVWFIYLQISSQGFLVPFTSISNGIPDYLTIASLTAISFAIGYFIKYLGVHKFIDRLPLFRFQKDVNGYITRSLQKFFCERFRDKIDEFHCPKEYEYLDIFYEYINKQIDSWITQRSLYFSYYTKYGLSMNLIALSIFGVIVIGSIIILRHNFGNYGGFALGFFTLVGLSAFLISQLKIKREIIDSITRPQIYRIIYDNSEDLKNKLECRFKTANYRDSYNKKYEFRGRSKIILPIAIIGLGVLLLFPILMPSSPATNISCPTRSPNLCIGTNSDDTMDGTVYSDIMEGKKGNDRINGNGGNDNMSGTVGSDEINGGDGHDSMHGGSGNDNMDGGGGNGNDYMSGGSGPDNIDDGSGNDVLFQNNAINEPDGYMDVINCGPGKDFAFIIEGDGDIAANDCETINP